MSKRKAEELDFDDLDRYAGIPPARSSEAGIKKHSLDSDEEDNVDSKKYEIMGEDDIEGQEDATIEFDGDIKITPFNMKEELEEGHFDKEGNYFLNKEEAIRDSWLDNIDWAKIRPQDKKSQSDDDSDSSLEPVNKVEIFKQMLDYMKPGETILKAIRRLGSKSSIRANASSRWNKKKKEENNTAKDEAPSEETQKMLALTELADKLLHSGMLEIYNESYERLNHAIRSHNRTLNVGTARNDDEMLDMFGDNFDESSREPRPSSSRGEHGDMPVDSSSTATDNSTELDTAIMWEFKWEDVEEARVYGPHSTAEMQQWVDDGYFAEGVWVRRADQPNAAFYTSKRVDFELYM